MIHSILKGVEALVNKRGRFPAVFPGRHVGFTDFTAPPIAGNFTSINPGRMKLPALYKTLKLENTSLSVLHVSHVSVQTTDAKCS